MIGKQALDEIVAATGDTSAARTARALREANQDLWPQGVQGGRKPAFVFPHHLVNLWLAKAKNAVIHAPEAAKELGAAKAMANAITFPDRLPPDSYTSVSLPPEVVPTPIAARLSAWQEIMRSSNLFDSMCWFIDWLAELDADTLALVDSGDLTFSVIVHSSPILGESVTINFHYIPPEAEHKIGSHQSTLMQFGSEAFSDTGFAGRSARLQAAVTEIRIFNTPFFRVLAKCWASTKDRLAQAKAASDPGSAPGSAGSDEEGENPGTGIPGLSKADQAGSGEHSTNYPTALGTRRDGSSMELVKARGEGLGPCLNPSKRHHVPDHQLALV